MIGAVIVMAIVFPQAAFLIAGGAAGGGVLAIFWIARRNRRDTSKPGGDSPHLLFRNDTPNSPVPTPEPDGSPSSAGRRALVVGSW
jgi:hypothetical protein